MQRECDVKCFGAKFRQDSGMLREKKTGKCSKKFKSLCPQNNGIMDDATRQRFWDDHNFDRSIVARKAVTNAVGLRPASQMKQLRNYDCALEYAAYLRASQCSATDESASAPSNNENQYIHRNLNTARPDVAKEVGGQLIRVVASLQFC
ncbi:hypothetical protein ANCCEY_11919 [Ancylostoma ceylanicum]|uniref:Uncharacterized protein n=1 Tax=Ancylostoma ceylanicum TaxID=53326 RepID=A0A0D6LCM0_9BILA|nr:hypothetical protein ANCCEY_11919 [Ancylostoma ceylanicum]